jgi:hypothetical protein
MTSPTKEAIERMRESLAHIVSMDSVGLMVKAEDLAQCLASHDKLVAGLRNIRRKGLKYNDTGWGSYQDGYAEGLKEASDQAANLLKDIEQ